MSLGTQVAGCLCVVLAGAVVGGPGAAASNVDPRGVAAAVLAGPAEPSGGFTLDRLSKGDRRLWRAIEQVVVESGPSGAPRSPALRRLWDWARSSTHVLRIEMVPRSKLPAGTAAEFRVERVDPAGGSHVAVIRLCPDNVRGAKVSAGPEPIEQFVRFEGLTDVERFAEVLAHEIAHAEYFLETPERLAALQNAQRTIDELLSRAARPGGPSYDELPRLLREPLAVLAACEAHAESVEAMVVRELTGTRPSAEAIARSR